MNLNLILKRINCSARFLVAFLFLSMMLCQNVYAGEFKALRTWPAEDYTRVTIEHEGQFKTKHFLLENPSRLVVDIFDAQLNDVIKTLPSIIKEDDPYIQKVRIGQLDEKTVRLVFEVKSPIKPQIFSLGEVAGKFKKRLVIDLYPKNPVDPIAALIAKGEWKLDPTPEPVQEQTKKRPSSQPDKSKDRPLKLKRMVTIVIDPGHGGEDSGALGATGSKEKDVVLSIGKKLKAKIEDQPNMRVVMTRNADFFVPLERRVQKARAVHADLFISIHADAYTQKSAHGASVFVLSERGASSTAARLLAKRENAADLIGGVNIKRRDRQLASVLLDLSTTAQIRDSMKLGSAVLKEIGTINRLHKGHVEQAGFAVLKAPDIPSILVETAFISNPEEEQKLNDSEHQEKIADAILLGVKKYFSKNQAHGNANLM